MNVTQLRRSLQKQLTFPLTRGMIIDSALFLVFSLALVFLTNDHVLWRDEAQAWLIAKQNFSWIALHDALSYEAHPLLWYLVIWPFAQLSDNPDWIKPPNLIIALLTSAFVWKKFLRTTLERVLFSSGFYFLFGYAVIARSYMLGIFCAFLALDEYKKGGKSWLFYIALILLANTHIYTMVLAGAFLVTSLITHYRDDKKGTFLSPRHIFQLIVTILGLCFAVETAFPVKTIAGLDLAHMQSEHGKSMFAILQNAFLPQIPLPDYIAPLFILIAAAICGAAFYVSAEAGLFLCLGGGTLLFIQSKIYSGNMQHFGVVWIFFLLGLLMARDKIKRKGLAQKRMIGRGILALLFLHTLSSAYALPQILSRPYSQSKNTAHYIRKTCETCTLVMGLDYLGTPVSAYLGGKEIFSLNQNKFGSNSMLIASRRKPEEITFDDMLAAAHSFSNVLILSHQPLSLPQLISGKMVLLKTFDGAVLDEENYYIYRFASYSQAMDKEKAEIAPALSLYRNRKAL